MSTVEDSRCSLCSSLGGGEKTILFKESTLKKCHDIYQARAGTTSKWSKVSLPSELDGVSGYHVKCYKSYTAFTLTKSSSNLMVEVTSAAGPSLQNTQRSTRSSSDITSSQRSTGVYEKNCWFCKKKEIKKKGKKEHLILVLTTQFQEGLLRDAEALQDTEMIGRMSGVDFIAKEVHYHKTCRSIYFNRAQTVKTKKEPKSSGDWQERRSAHQQSFKLICDMIEETVLKQGGVCRLNELYGHYMSCLEELLPNKEDTPFENYLPHHLQEKIENYFKNKVQVVSHANKKIGKMIIDSLLSLDVAMLIAVEQDSSMEAKLKEVAFYLRRLIISSPHKPLPSHLTIQDLLEGEVEIPELLLLFFAHLINGPIQRKGKDTSEIKKIRINSLASDTVFAATNGRFKPAKHLTLGMTLKTMTGSRKAVTVANRYGHAINYSLVEELETELAFTASANCRLLPDGMIADSDLHTGVAFDNFDRFVDTSNGRDTLHDTVSICYQDYTADVLPMQPITIQAPEEELVNPSQRKRRRRAFESSDQDIAPYHKVPRLTNEIMLDLDDPRRERVPASRKRAEELDLLWTASLAFSFDSTSMWNAWNSKFVGEDPLPKQRIAYMPQINRSPTSNDVVLETMNMSLKVAEECGNKYTSVTYDLAIAQKAFEIQSIERPRFDSLFIQMGSFHIELSFFKALGKFIAESGAPYILTETGIIAQGSLLGFLSGKHYNRCKRVHPLLAAALQMLHFEAFLDTVTDDLKEDASSALDYINRNPLFFTDLDSEPPALGELLKKYQDFIKQTLNGDHGQTAKYWMMYISFVRMYNTFIRSVRTGDHELFINILPEMIHLFFVFNHQNYARWLSYFYNNMLRMEETHPGISDDFVNGILSVRRTERPFSRLPIDLTLEQTINADAASKLTGITALTNSTSARRRWAVNHYMRVAVASKVFDHLGLNRRDEIAKEALPSQMKKNQKHLMDLKTFLKNCRDPFKPSESTTLVNIASGKEASLETSRFLLNVPENGKRAYCDFVEGCIIEPSRFYNPIPRQKLFTFASEGLKVKRKRTDGKIQEVRMERDLFGRLIILALQEKVDMEYVLSYPLTPVPLCFGQIDGSINKTNKAVLFAALESKIATRAPDRIDAYIVDGYFFLHLQKELPLMWSKVARHILQKLCNFKSNRIDLVFDRVISPSIKDGERDRRSEAERSAPFKISGGNQHRPDDFIKLLRNDNFKKEIVRFLVESWSDNSLAHIVGDKEINITQDSTCYSLKVLNGSLMMTENEALKSSHEEADSRMICHLSTIPSPSKVVIRTADTDVLAIALGNISNIDQNIRVFLEVGIQSKNTLRFIDVSALAGTIGSSLSKALPAFHAFTGCDFTPAFARKGKKRPLALLEKNESFCAAFASLGSTEKVSDEVIRLIEKFVCHMYGLKKLDSVDEARLEIFLKSHKPSAGKNPFSRIKGIDGSSLPPCRSVLIEQILRVNSICSSWSNATQLEPTIFPPENNGWELSADGKYVITWFKGDMAPRAIEERAYVEETHTSNGEEESDQESFTSGDESSDEDE